MKKEGIKEFREWISLGIHVLPILGFATLLLILKNIYTFLTLELKIQLWFVILILALLLLLFLNVIKIHMNNKKLKNDLNNLHNPNNSNLANFKQGELVFHKQESIHTSGNSLVVDDINFENQKIQCRNRDGMITSYHPNELYTSTESKHLINALDKDLYLTNQPTFGYDPYK